MHTRRTALAVPALVTALGLAACATAPPAPAGPADTAPGHGAIAGAAEVAEPPLALLSVSADGAVGVLDLLDGTTTALGPAAEPTGFASDGRYGLLTTAAGLEVVDSGRWTWDHGDHFHYYLAEPAILGTVAGAGAVTVTAGPLSTAGSTGAYFAGSDEAVLLDNAALSDGRIVERFRLTGADAGLIAPFGDGALVAAGDRIVHRDAAGARSDRGIACPDPAGAVVTRAGVVIGCADGAVLATGDGAERPELERIPYPAAAAAERAWSFSGRKGRPTVAAPAGTEGFWLLDTRERSWQLVRTSAPLVAVSAADDADGHVVGIDSEGRVRVFAGPEGSETAASEPLVDPDDAGLSLTLDGQRAYVNDAASGLVLEIDYADGGRIARSLAPDAPARFVGEVGR